ncbi:putative ATPase, AAA family [Mesorhizobium prunaredense]|uniref:Putative ATPase, AAA family n=1 Tax=Mesorhizobium prunaredense TaxID=1631249 RepID=A0A1R3VJL8_9HYPH|nr:ATP-binding protein [Mesorhizobium prunaredense]SIT58631.1 putative ATPase, AAA family [Mesorhizobium prunaredense]
MLLAPAPIPGYRRAGEHLADELAWLDLLLARHVAWLRATGQFNEDPLRGLYITDAEVAARLAGAEQTGHEHDHRIAAKRTFIDARLGQGDLEMPLLALARQFGLDDFERGCLLMAAASAIEPRYETLFAYAHNDVSRKLPTPGLALALLASTQQQRFEWLACFSAQSPLFRCDLLRMASADAGRPLVGRGLAMDERLAFALLGADRGADERLAAFTAVMGPPLVPWRPDALLEQIASGLGKEWPTSAVLLDGPPDSGQRQLTHAASSRLGLKLIEADLSHPAAALLPAQELGRLLAREALLCDAVLLATTREAAADRRHEATIAAAVQAGATAFVAPAPGTVVARNFARGTQLVEIAMPAPTMLQRGHWWRSAFEAAARPHDPVLPSRLGLALRCGPDAMAAVAASLDPQRPLDFRDIADAARRATRAEVPSLARLVRPHWRWDDLVLPERQAARLRQICAELDHAPRVLHDWSFAGKAAAGHNNLVLFSGASGTGKTMAASLIAAAIGLDLYRVDLSAMVDKYIGETEKNLERMFAAMEVSNAVVFFDEADVLFSKRTEVKDAHDRYANLSVAYLLQRIEAYEGLVVLATNLAGNMDDAFSRRLRHIVHFPLPDVRMRRQLWARAFPEQTPLASDLDLDALATRFELTGGSIRNVALASAYLAAAEDLPVCQRHALQAVAVELEKLGRPPTRDDFGDAYGLLVAAQDG